MVWENKAREGICTEPLVLHQPTQVSLVVPEAVCVLSCSLSVYVLVSILREDLTHRSRASATKYCLQESWTRCCAPRQTLYFCQVIQPTDPEYLLAIAHASDNTG